MRRVATVLLVLMVTCFSSGIAQECGPDWGSGTGSAFAYWVEADGVQRTRHTNLATALAAMADSVRSRPEASWRVKADFRGEWRGPCGGDTASVVDTTFVQDTLPPVQDTLPPVQDTTSVVDTTFAQDTLPAHQDTLPPVQDTTIVEVCPEDWTCEIPEDSVPTDTTTVEAPPIPQGAYLRDSPLITDTDTLYLEIGWGEAGGGDPPPTDIDSTRVSYGANDASFTRTSYVPPNAQVVWLDVPADSADLWGCVYYVRETVESPEGGCSGLDGYVKPDSIRPMSSYYITTTRPDGTRPTHVSEWSVGDSLQWELRLDCGLDAEVPCGPTWPDSTAAFPDSVIFEVNGDRHRELSHPYIYPAGGSEWYTIPQTDTVDVDVWIYGEGLLYDGNGDGELFLGTAIPLP